MRGYLSVPKSPAVNTNGKRGRGTNLEEESRNCELNSSDEMGEAGRREAFAFGVNDTISLSLSYREGAA